jgi:ATP-dependent helicase/nuclease subunit A
LDEVQDEELRNRSWREFITNARSAGDHDMLDLLATGVRPTHLESAFAIICGNDDVEFPAGDASCPDPGPASKALETFWANIEKLLPEKLEDETTCKIQKAARQFRAQMRVSRRKLEQASTIAELLETWKCESKIVQKWWAESTAEKKRFKELIEPLHERFCEETVTPYLSQWRQYVYRLSVTILTRARDHAKRERYRRNSLNYGDLLNLTAKVLRENAHVRRALQQKYRHLFVDEFQDTDPVQAEIVFLLASEESKSIDGDTPKLGPTGPANSTTGISASQERAASCEPRAADWRAVPLRAGALFVVGDPKQSIYRFRRADIEIYNTVRERFTDPAVGGVVPLTMNFRSVPALCEWANTVFTAQFPPAPTLHSPQFAPLDPKEPDRSSKPQTAAGLFTLTHRCEDGSEVAALDAAAIARYIRTEVDAGRRRFSDFLILTRKKKARIAPYASALEALNIPIEVSGAGAFGESAKVAALTTLLRALADPQDQLTLVNVLRGPLFGISDRELFDFRQSGGWFSIFAETAERNSDPASRIPASGAAVREALAALWRYHRWTRILPPGAALDKILEHTGYLAAAATTPGGVEAGDLLHAVDRVRQVLEEGGNLADAADALEADSDAANDVESLPLEPGRSDVVRLMNLHKAKGLEADVVFLADPCGGVGKWVDVHIKRDGAHAYGWFKVEKKSEGSFGAKLLGQHADWAQHEAAEEPYLEAEENRLLYVAATRARQILVVSRFTGKVRSAAWGALNQFLDAAQELPVPKQAKVESLKPASSSASMQAEALAARTVADKKVKEASWFITSVTAEAKHISKMAGAPAPAAADDATRVIAQDTPSHRADAGMAWGTLIHGLLEHAMRHKGVRREDLTRVALWLTVEDPELRPVIENAVNTVFSVAGAAFWQEATRTNHSVETPFATRLGDQVTNGVIDLLFDTHAGWHVVDYKTDTTIVHGRYAQQIEAYKTALRAVGCSVADAAIVSVRTGPA